MQGQPVRRRPAAPPVPVPCALCCAQGMVRCYHRCVAVPALLCAMLAALLAQLRPPFASSPTPLGPTEQSMLLDARRRPLRLTQQQRQEFAATGLLLLRDLIPAPVVHSLRAVVVSEPPSASPLFADNLDYVVSYAWAFYRSFGQLSAAGLTAGVASQLLLPGGGATRPSPGQRQRQQRVRLVNSVVYGLGRQQHGADWHTDEISYRAVTAVNASARGGGGGGGRGAGGGVSAWVPLQPVGQQPRGGGGGLLLVPSNTVGRQCFYPGVHDLHTGRVRWRSRGGGGTTAAEEGGAAARAAGDDDEDASECMRTLTQRGVSAVWCPRHGCRLACWPPQRINRPAACCRCRAC